MTYNYSTRIISGSYGENVSTDTCEIASPQKPAPVPNPGYFSALRTGSPLPIGTWDRDIVESSIGSGVLDGRVTYNGRYYGSRFEGNLGNALYGFETRKGQLTEEISNDPIAESALHQRAIDGAKNSAWDIATFSAEIHKTASLVGGVSDRVFERAQNILMRRGPGRVIKTMYEFAQVWLEYRYGWRLLMYDIEAMEESLHKSKESMQISLERYTAHDSRVASLKENSGPTTSVWLPCQLGSTPYTSVLYDRTTTQQVDVRYGAGVTSYAASNITINPLLTVWEILPYSFLVDRLVDVGSAIGALTPTLGRSLKYVWRSERRETTSVHQMNWSQPASIVPNGTTGIGNAGQSVARHSVIDYHRASVSSLPWSLNINPRLDIPLGLDIAALVLVRDKRVKQQIGGRF